MSRIKDLRQRVYQVLESIEDNEKRSKAVAHLHGVALAAAILARKRGEDAELATFAGLLHDLHAYQSGSYEDHAHRGAELARTILNEMRLTTPEETEIICSAIYHHDNKAVVDASMDELLKDADVIDHSLSDPTKEVKAHERKRYVRLCAEMGWPQL